MIYPGREGTAAGPDFRDALLEVEGQGLVRGDVELHVRQRDWRSHGHSEDPNYNGVELHAALEVESSSTGLHSGGRAPVVSLAPLLEGEGHPGHELESGVDAKISQDLWDLLEPLGYRRPSTAQQAGELLDRAGDQRFGVKSRVFAMLLDEGAPGQAREDQSLYEGLMEGLGYKVNQQAFLSLAQRAPWRRLVQLTKGLPGPEVLHRVAGWLSVVSGLALNSPVNQLVNQLGNQLDEKLPRGLASLGNETGQPPAAPGGRRRRVGTKLRGAWVDRGFEGGV